MARTLRERLWGRVAQAPCGCWEWQGAKRANGYGSFAVKRADGRWTYTTAHRAAYLDQVGPIPEGWEVDHLCKNRGCVRPDHLEAVTIQENRRRRDEGHSPVIDRRERPLPELDALFLPPPSPKRPSWLCKNGHDTREVGRVANGLQRGQVAFTCAACRADQYARRRKGGAHGSETHCPQGHPYDDENTYRRVRPDGTVQRECRTCTRARNRAAHQRRARANRGPASGC